MNHLEFVVALERPLYSWRMAKGATGQALRFADGRPNGSAYSAATRMERAQERIDDLVLARASAIRLERIREGKRKVSLHAEHLREGRARFEDRPE
jgi:hypothetical protein